MIDEGTMTTGMRAMLNLTLDYMFAQSLNKK
jgi:hypothetical protein